ncbi:MAG TPA: GDSL-type esterase/lipase family protein [Thermoanaerobaculia bacterium]|jgi:lysophospholipase L1-like esterase
MRRFFFWYLPLAAALAAGSVFAYGFVSFVRGDTGSPVDFLPSTQTAEAPRAVLAPIILGDSLARGAGDAEGLGISGRLDQELRRRNIRAQRTVNLAVNGARTPDLLRVLDRANVKALIAQSNVVILSIGGNDLWGGNDWRNAAPPNPDAVMDDVMKRIESAISTVRTANPKARIFFVGLYNPFLKTPMGTTLTPLVYKWNARLTERFANDPNFTVIQTADLFTHRNRLAIDGFHPSGEGYGLIARRIADGL